MGVFDDKKFEELDWISQATEPMDSELNVILGKLPEELDIDLPLLRKVIGDNYSFDLDISRVISHLMSEHAPGHYLDWNTRHLVTDCFEFQVDPDIVVNFEDNTMSGAIKLIKIQNTMDEKVLENILGRSGIDRLGSMYIPADNGGPSRANEVLEILGKCEKGMSTRSLRKKQMFMKQRLAQIMKGNEWKIKDTELANKVGTWIYQYVVDGNLKAWSNFCRLKVMTHKDQPIYSMEEV